MLNGTFDWDKYGTILLEKFAQYVQKGYINVDITTADTVAAQTVLGKEDCAFVFRGVQNVANARHYSFPIVWLWNEYSGNMKFIGLKTI